jgi:diguanylate cyclase
MTAPVNEHERTLAFAEVALGQIKALQQPATPRHFEIWYTYATGYNATLNKAINDVLARSATLSASEMDQIYDDYLSPDRFTGRIDRFGGQVMGEIEGIIQTIGTAAGTASRYSGDLARVTQELARTADGDSIRAIVEGLVQTTHQIHQANKALEERLSASKNEITTLQRNLDAVRQESLTDPLTSLANRKYFDEALAKAIENAKAGQEPVSLLMADIDQFKAFNDRFGHLTGDHVLRLVAAALKQSVREGDVTARYGGEEFAIVLCNTMLRAAIRIGEQIRTTVMSKELVRRSSGENLGRVTISVGAATLRPDDTAQSLIERADNCLYAAKRCGRNRVICEADPEVAMDFTFKVA